MIDPIASLNVRAHTLAQFLVQDIVRPQLAASDVHHLARVLRARNGERVCVIDGRGSWRVCAWQDDELQSVGDVETQTQDTPALRIAFPFLKSDKTEVVVQKLTELGIDELQLLLPTNASVRIPAAKLEKVMTRLRKVAHEAAMQSRRVWLPTVVDPIPPSEAVGGGYVLAHWGGQPLSDVVSGPGESSLSVAIGPEGGWTDAELALCRTPFSLGQTVLRAETAAIAAAALISAVRA